MGADTQSFSTLHPLAVLDAAPVPALHGRVDGRGETFTMFIEVTTGIRQYLTEHGKAWRINGHWHVARDGCRPTFVSNPEFRAALDANEWRSA